jgi:hypothetical protein
VSGRRDMMRGELTRAVFIAWAVASGAVLCALLAPFVLSADQLRAAAAGLSVEHHKPCPLCGMTTAFGHIARGDLARAQASNRAAVPLFALSPPLAAACSVPVRPA